MSVNKLILNGGTNVIGGNSTLEKDLLVIGPGGLEITGGQMKMNLGNQGDTNLGSGVVLNGDVTSFASGLEAGFFGESAAGTFGTRTIDIGSTMRKFTVEDGPAINDLRVQFPIVGTGTLVKVGAGQLFLEGASTYSGNTEITEGTVVLGLAASLASPNVHVAAGATLDVVQQFTGYNIPAGQNLKVDGTLSGSVRIAGVLSGTGLVANDINVMAGGVLAPGGSPGVLTVNGLLTFNDDSFFSVELGGKTPGNGAGHYDQLSSLNFFNSSFIGNNVTLNVSVDGFNPSLSDVFYVYTRADSDLFALPFANALEGATVDFGNGVTGKITYQANWTGDQATSTLTGGNDIAIYNVIAVPEPGAATLLLGGLALFAGRRRKR
jgi:autotransporter-associated beta strand protein